VFITGRRQAELDKAAAELGSNVMAIRGDASSLADIDRIYEIVRLHTDQIHVLLVNAGFYELGKLGEITEEHFDKTFDTNVRGLLFSVQKALPLLKRGSSVILTGSIAASKGMPSLSVYSATKAAVRSFARSWMLDLRGRGIRVNVLSPGHTVTPGLDRMLGQNEQAKLVEQIPLDRMGTSDDLGKAAVFLASDASAYITGTELVVDGGAAQY
jgi:NAD(P)-dependent dehydrogenase (short-subunit alcohol dehydrogenase family)